MQVNQQTLGTQQVSDQALTDAVEEALMMAEFFDLVGQEDRIPDLEGMPLFAQLQSTQKQILEAMGIDEFAIQIEAKAGRPI